MNNSEMLLKKLNKTKETNFDDICLSELDDICELKISKKQNTNEKIVDFIKSTNNPYCFKYGDKLIKIEFSNNGKQAEECLTNVIKSIYK